MIDFADLELIIDRLNLLNDLLFIVKTYFT